MKKLVVVCLLGALGIETQAWAQVSPGAEANRQRDIDDKQRQQERVERELELQKHRERAAPIAPIAPAAPVLTPVVGAEEFQVERIRIVNDALTDAANLPLIAAYEHTKIGGNEIVALIKGLTDYYAAQGYATTAVTVGPQNIKSGTLELTVRWGYVEDVLIDGHTAADWREALELWSAMPNMRGRILNMRDVDQMVENLSNAAKTAKVEIQPAPRDGYSYLNLTFEPRAKFGLSGSMDNSNQSDPQARVKVGVQASMSDLFGLNDSLSIGLGRSFLRFPNDNEQHNWSLNYSLPVGYWSLSASLSNYHYEKVLTGVAGAYDSEGLSSDAKLRASYVLSRDSAAKSTAWLELATKGSQNYLAGSLLDVSSKRYSSVSVGAGRSDSLGGGVVYGDVSVTRGVDWFGGFRGEPGRQAGDPQPLYTKANASLTWQRNFEVASLPAQYAAKLAGQYGRDALLSANLLSIGDEYTVRGYITDPLQGEQGAYLNNSLSFPLRSEIFGPWVQAVTPVLGLDVGGARSVGGAWAHLAGMAAGVKVDGKYGQLSMTFSRPLYAPPELSTESVVYLSLSWHL